MKKALVLGAGLAGLGFARACPGARVFEAASHPGGHVWSHELDGNYFDEGAHICHAKGAEWLELIYGQAGRVVQIDKSRVSNYWHGHWVTYPVQNFLHELPADARDAALRGVLDAQARHGGKEPRHYREWCEYQYGSYLTDRFYKEYTEKYWRVPMEELATDWLSGRLIPAQVARIVAGAQGPQEDSQSVFTRFHYPAHGGFFSFFKKLYEGVDVTLNCRAIRVEAEKRRVHFANGTAETYDTLASSIPLPDLVRMTAEAPADVREAAAALRHTQLLCVNLVVGKPDLSPYHWFYIYDKDIDIARVSVPSNIAPGSARAGTTAFQAEIFRRADEAMDEQALADKAVRDLGRIVGFDPREVRARRTVRVPHAYVISDARRAAAVDLIVAWFHQRGIQPMGLFGAWRFIWSDAAYASGARAAAAPDHAS